MAERDDCQVQAWIDDRGIAEMRMSNRTRRNALTGSMRESVCDLLEAWDEDPMVRVVVIGGSGDASFCSGRDLSEALSPAAAQSESRSWARFWGAWRQFSKPVVAMIDGHCVGDGVLIALQADMRVCTERSSFSFPAVRMDVPSSYDSAGPLVSALGAVWAAEMVFADKQFGPTEALASGLVSRVLGHQSLYVAATRIALEAADKADLGIRPRRAAFARIDSKRDPAVALAVRG